MFRFLLRPASSVMMLALCACGTRFTAQEDGAGGNTGGGGATSSSNSVGGSSQGGSGGGAGGGGVTCPPNGLSHFVDTFDDGSLAPNWEVYGADAAGERDGYAYITLGSAGDVDTWVVSTESYTFHGCEAAIEVTNSPNCAGCVSSLAVLDANDPNNYVWIALEDGVLYFEEYIGNGIVDGISKNVDGRFWSLREEDGEVFMSTSTDGVEWDTKLKIDTPQWAGDVEVEIHAGGITDGNSLELRVDNFNAMP